ncbi:MAG: hypothetical protein AAF221_01015 [Pseudomonadota bacterium]
MSTFSITYPWLCAVCSLDSKLFTQELARHKLLYDVTSKRGSPRLLNWDQAMRLQVYLYLRRAGLEPALAAEAAVFVKDYSNHYGSRDVPMCNPHTQLQTYLDTFTKRILLVKIGNTSVSIERPYIADVQSYDVITSMQMFSHSAAFAVPLHGCAEQCAEIYFQEHNQHWNEA